MKMICVPVLLLTAGLACAAQQANLIQESQFQNQLREIEEQSAASEKLNHALGLLPKRHFSSLQVKTICARLPGDAERLEFASAAFRRVVDPENFYEVYDAFNSFSKVFRLHDFVRGTRLGDSLEPVVAVQPVSEDALRGILKTLRNEPFEDTRITVAKQIFKSSRKNFRSEQVLQVLKIFKFDDNRLEVAKSAYEAVLDPENYFVVNEVFNFPQTREALATFIQTKSATTSSP